MYFSTFYKILFIYFYITNKNQIFVSVTLNSEKSMLMKFLNKTEKVVHKVKKAPELPKYEFKFNKNLNFWNKEKYLSEKFKYNLKEIINLYEDEIIKQGQINI